MANRFAPCTTINEVIGQAVGAGSTCWVDRHIPLLNQPERVFDSEEAVKVVDEACARVRELIYEMVNEMGIEVSP